MNCVDYYHDLNEWINGYSLSRQERINRGLSKIIKILEELNEDLESELTEESSK